MFHLEENRIYSPLGITHQLYHHLTIKDITFDLVMISLSYTLHTVFLWLGQLGLLE